MVPPLSETRVAWTMSSPTRHGHDKVRTCRGRLPTARREDGVDALGADVAGAGGGSDGLVRAVEAGGVIHVVYSCEEVAQY